MKRYSLHLTCHALRIYDPKQNIDYIFNYGIFDFSKPNFIYRFAAGETDYKLGVADFKTM